MNDTVIMATSNESLQQKLDVLHDFCSTHGMSVNVDKTKFMVINGGEGDMLPFRLGDMFI